MQRRISFFNRPSHFYCKTGSFAALRMTLIYELAGLIKMTLIVIHHLDDHIPALMPLFDI